MSQLSFFYGNYVVISTANTPFGVGTKISIFSPTEDSFAVQLEGMTQDSTFTYGAEDGPSVTYDATADSIILQGDSTLDFVISCFVDSREPNYRLIYGYHFRDKCLFAARRVEDAKNAGFDLQGAPAEMDSFPVANTIEVTCGAQFGPKSIFELLTNSETSATAEVDGGQTGMPPMEMNLEESVLRGEIQMVFDNRTERPVTLQISHGTVPNSSPPSRFIYGVSVVGDPQQAGTFGSDSTP